VRRAVLITALFCGCSDDASAVASGDAAVADTSVRTDASRDVASDVGADTTAVVDTAPTPGPGAVGAPCAADAECASLACLAGRCSAPCAMASDCPPSWTCEASRCRCTPKATEVCNGRDDDCDGVVDNGAKCSDVGYVCIDGACGCPPERMCGGRCIPDLTNDPKNCGACGKTCAAGATCSGSVCACPTAMSSVCGGACVDLQTNANHCGGCDVRCGSLGTCVTGACKCSGVRPLFCGSCVDGDSDRANCGACGTACDVLCTGGTCRTVTSVHRGSDWTCALMSDTTVRCWGRNNHGQLGDGTTTDRTQPVPVPGLTNVTQVAVGISYQHVTGATCARLGDGTMRCWGLNYYGQVGDGTTTDRLTPYNLGLTNVVQVAIGWRHGCALIADGTVRCWGSNSSGELGNGGTAPTTTPSTVLGLSNATQITVGSSASCARTSGGRVLCWGSNVSYVLGYVGEGRAYASDVGLADVAEVHLGSAHACARLTSGSVRCWGNNMYGQLGDGTTYDRSTPTAGTGAGTVVQLSVGGVATAVRLADGRVYRWGYGWTGDGSVADNKLVPTPMVGLSSVTQISVGFDGMCARQASSNGAFCWGQNLYGAVGDGTTTTRLAPTAVSF